jgi:hypothetical protein
MSADMKNHCIDFKDKTQDSPKAVKGLLQREDQGSPWISKISAVMFRLA